MAALDYWTGATYDCPELTASRIPAWEQALEPFRGQIRSVLEVGSYEGLSALFWVRFFDANVTCIDNWQNALQPPTDVGTLLAAQAEKNFDRNASATGKCRKMKTHSTLGLDYLNERGETFDLIYIDGDHARDQVMIDSLLAWRLLKPGGLMIWDDWREYAPGGTDELRPETAIAAFCAWHHPDVIADTGQQLICQKI